MKLYQLLWVLLKHGLKGRFRDEVFLSIDLDNERRQLGITGAITSFRAEARREAFCFLDGTCEDPDPWSEDPPFIYDLIEASSLGTPEARALRDSVPDEVVDRIMARYREIESAE